MKKIISLVMIGVFTLLCLSSCATKYSSNNAETALTIGEKEISFDLFRYFYMSYKTAKGNENKTEEEIKQATITSLKELVAIEKTAEKYDLEVSDEVLDLLKKEMVAMRDSYPSTDEMITELSKNFLSEQVYYDIYYHIELEAVVSAYLAEEANMIIISSDKVVKDAIEKDFLAAVNIIIYPDTEKDGLKGKDLAESIYQRILNGEDILTLAENYSDDGNYEPRYFAPLTMQADFEQKVKEMKIGEISPVYESELGYGYYITKRIEITDDYIEKNFNELRQEYIYSQYLKLMTELTDSYTVTFSEDFDLSKIDY